ncbi:unnamed protein product [Echinostoma caproni]|uniref:Ectonucleotide pyrophosphatase/phosphodiesterase family member 3 n=1 Tax=Echinostoma caproni TaxID=27848 RepID=A0A183AAB2_9TREM|nr:unnamed protein product [Echinostoma caproni]
MECFGKIHIVVCNASSSKVSPLLLLLLLMVIVVMVNFPIRNPRYKLMHCTNKIAFVFLFPILAMPEDDTHVSYHRFDSYEFSAKRRRRMHRLGFVNFVLAIVLVVFGIMLIGALVSRAWYHNRFWPYDNNPCTDLHTNCPLLLISMDGFPRYGPNALPNFNRLERHGVRAMQSVGAYPTMTMPNQHTLVTGLYPESHGIVANNIRDTKWPNVIFEMYNQTSLNEAPWLEGWPEPIWVTLQRTGRRVGSLLWPFTDGTVHGDLPFVQVSQFTLLDDTPTPYPYKKRVTDLLWWLDNPYYQLDLILAYFEEPDKSGHIYGPDSEEVAKLVVELDQRVGQLLDGLEKKGLANKVDIIVTADHGMTRITNVICLDDYVDPELYTHTQLSTLGFLYPNYCIPPSHHLGFELRTHRMEGMWVTTVPTRSCHG